MIPRPVRDADSQDLFGLLSLCFADYPGCFVDPHDDLADLRRPATALEAGAAFWAVEDGAGRVGACIAVSAVREGEAELHRLYVRPDLQGRGLARGLVRLAEDHAAAAGAGRMTLWSDTRFTRAHRLYERLGYARRGEPRTLGDVSGSREFRYERSLGPA